MKIEEIKRMLLTSLDIERLWTREFLLLLEEQDLVIDDAIGSLSRKKLLGDSKIHRYTTSKSGRFVTGFDELIESLEKDSSDEIIFDTEIRGKKKFGILYFKENRKVVGGVVIENPPPRPKKLPSWMSSGKNGEHVQDG